VQLRSPQCYGSSQQDAVLRLVSRDEPKARLDRWENTDQRPDVSAREGGPSHVLNPK